MQTNYLTIDSIRVYGSPVASPNQSVIQNIRPTSSSQFHIARHYPALTEEYIWTLIGRTYQYFDDVSKKLKEAVITEELMQEALKTKGSKFSENFTSKFPTPNDVIDLACKQALDRFDELSWLDCGFTITTFFSITMDEPAGYLGVIKVSDVKDVPDTKITSEPRGQAEGDTFTVNIVYNYRPALTNQLAIQIGRYKEQNDFSVMTAYAGSFAPDYPGSGQSPEEFEYNKTFWDDHAFIA